MPKAVRYNEFGGIDVLDVVEVDRPVPGPGEVLVQVKAAGINPGEASHPVRRVPLGMALDVPVGSGQRPRRRGRRAG